MKASPSEIVAHLKLLTETPRRLEKVTRGFDSMYLGFKPDENSWSVNEILAHLRACADVWGDSIEAMLAEENPKVPYRHPRQWIKKRNYIELPFHESFQAFIVQRRKLMSILKPLSLEEWSRAATIQGRERTVFTQVRRMAMHEDVHCEQIENLLR